jgi:hypothetical protein
MRIIKISMLIITQKCYNYQVKSSFNLFAKGEGGIYQVRKRLIKRLIELCRQMSAKDRIDRPDGLLGLGVIWGIGVVIGVMVLIPKSFRSTSGMAICAAVMFLTAELCVIAYAIGMFRGEWNELRKRTVRATIFSSTVPVFLWAFLMLAYTEPAVVPIKAAAGLAVIYTIQYAAAWIMIMGIVGWAHRRPNRCLI